MLSVHTSPLEQPGSGDAGGLNVYVAQTARHLAQLGVEVDIFTRATSSSLDMATSMAPGVTVHNIDAGPYQPLPKEDLPAQLCALTAGVLRAESARPAGWYDLIHSHYWLSGHVGWLASERWRVPLVHTMHTMARVKNNHLAELDVPEPSTRVIGEQQLVDIATRLIANTDDEAQELVDLYGATRDRIRVVTPGVDLDVFYPGSKRLARTALGLALDETLLVFVGRIQPHKAPHVLIRAAAGLVARDPASKVRVVICGGTSGSAGYGPEQLRELAAELGIANRVTFAAPKPASDLALLYRAADLMVVPSYSESFGLVALEAQACGTPVVAAAVGGLHTAVADGVSGVLVQGHDERAWTHVLADVLAQPETLAAMGEAAVRHAANFSWASTTKKLLAVYEETVRSGNLASALL
jgi:D-inositol-3-phosphate glycosyltransferase